MDDTLAARIAAPFWWFTGVLYGHRLCGDPSAPGTHHRRICVTPATPTPRSRAGGPDTPDGGPGVRESSLGAALNNFQDMIHREFYDG